MTQEASTRGGSYTNVYGYDGGTTGGPGNPTSFKGATNTFNADNQVSSTGYGYDGNGNPTTYKTAALTFDPENRMTSYGSVQTDGYDNDGLRAWKQTGGNPTRVYFLYDGGQPVCEFGSTGTLTVTNTFGADGLISRRNVSGSVTTFYTFDERGNVTQRTTSTGMVASTDLYDSYGSRTGTVSQPDPFGFEAQDGYYTDIETGLILCTNRFYDPAMGRWLTRDPTDYEGGINLYSYCLNNSVNEEDALGYMPQAPGYPNKPPITSVPIPKKPTGPVNPCKNPVYLRFIQTHPEIHDEWSFDEALDKWYADCKNLGQTMTIISAPIIALLPVPPTLKGGIATGGGCANLAWNKDCDKVKFKLKEIAHQCMSKGH